MDAKAKRFLKELEQVKSASVFELSQRLGVGERTVRNWIGKANSALIGAAVITGVRGRYHLDIEDEVLYRSLLASSDWDHAIPSTREERVAYLLEDLLSRPDWITVEELAGVLFVSARTLSDDLRSVSERFEQFGLSIEKRSHHGIRVTGEESARRLCLASLVADRLCLREGLSADDQRLAAIRSCVDKTLASEQFPINRMMYHNLLVHIYTAIVRIEAGGVIPVDFDTAGSLRGSRAFDVARHLAHAIEKSLSITLPEDEVAYIAIHLAARQTLEDNSEQGVIIADEVWDAVSEMIGAVACAYRFDFSHDLELRMNLARHLAPMRYRLINHMNADNPLLSEIKTRFPLAYSMAVVAAGALADRYGASVSDEETGYLALAFALAIDRQQGEPAKKNVVIVCASGQGSARLLEHRYRREFGDYINCLQTCDVSRVDTLDFSKIDYVFTTVPLHRKLPVPVREVTYFLESQDAVGIREVLRGDIASRLDAIGLFSPALFFPHLSFASKKDALAFLCERAVETGDVDASFPELVFKRESASATSFGNGIAMPHAMYPVGDKAFTTVGILDAPIAWDEYGHDVSIVFLVSFPTDGGDGARSLTALLADIFMDEEGLARLMRQQSFDELIRLIASHTA